MAMIGDSGADGAHRRCTEILLMTPSELDDQVRSVMDEIVARHGFTGYTSYAAKVGRGRFIEIHIVVAPDRQLGTVADLDAVRDEIADALGRRTARTRG